MSYEKRVVTSHSMPGLLSVSGATTGIYRINRLPGKRYCRIIEMISHITTAMVSPTTSFLMQVGDGSDLDKFVDDQILGVDLDAVGVARSTANADARVAAYNTLGRYIDWDTDGIAGTPAVPVVLAALVFTPVSGTGGSPNSGAVNLNTIIEWW